MGCDRDGIDAEFHRYVRKASSLDTQHSQITDLPWPPDPLD